MATARHHEELDAWKLATDLAEGVMLIVTRERVAKDRSFCDQIIRSSRSAPANVAEGFARYRPREFARYLRIAIGSLGETQNHLREAQRRNYIAGEEFEKLWSLSKRALGASIRLHNYLKRCPDRN